ncbi:type III secretion system (T3SS) SseB-like protein [Rhodobacter viridis]|uniref:Type III secretion system (T3SS) SseB-like protein n=1 Tax=Rhodobacter viridis TaxID=1054202 RepID=A0A318U5N1_9RHOB|nr:SseB family protein [Rhodobacter viridis]PYF09710.1 type III secretion system (T3SS) SseB-like protein [Rhodobacter viridis]
MTSDPTAYDRAHAAMEAEPENEALRLAVYDRLADAELFVLLENEPDAEDDIVPQVFETEEGDFVLAFDTEERLASFSEEPVPYAALPGRVIAQVLAGEGVGLGVNLGVADSAMLLPPEALEWLTHTLTHVPEAGAARPLEFAGPGLSPAVLALLLPAFEAKFEQLAGLATEAVLGSVLWEGGRRGHVLAFFGAPEIARPGIAKAMGEALMFSGLEAGELDVTFLDAADPAAAVLLEKGLVLHLPERVVEEVQELKLTAPGMDPDKPPILR